jgi:predicted HD phosphohydrolase
MTDITDITDIRTVHDAAGPHAPVARAAFTSFEESTEADWAIITTQLQVTQSHVADNVIAQLRMLRNDHGGFPVDRLEHSLQTATRAQRDGRDDEYVLCALLHDIGDNLAPYNHPDIAAGILKPFVSDAHHWMVAHHAIFQGYYFWHHLGADRHAREAYRDSPYFELTEEFCAKYDQTAFDPDYRSEPLEHFEPLIRSVFTPAR